MRHAEIVVDVIQRQLLVYAVLTCAERRHTPPDRGDMLADTEVEACNEGGVDLPATGRSDLPYRLECPEDHAMAHADQTPPAHGLDHLRIEQPGPRPPARLRHGAFAWAAWRLHPRAAMGEERCGVLREAVGQEEGHAARG